MSDRPRITVLLIVWSKARTCVLTIFRSTVFAHCLLMFWEFRETLRDGLKELRSLLEKHWGQLVGSALSLETGPSSFWGFVFPPGILEVESWFMSRESHWGQPVQPLFPGIKHHRRFLEVVIFSCQPSIDQSVSQPVNHWIAHGALIEHLLC